MPPHGTGNRGRWLVIGIVTGALILALLALFLRPRLSAPPPATQPTVDDVSLTSD